MSLKEFTRELNSKNVEGELIKTLIYSLITCVLTLGILYFVTLQNVPSFVSDYVLFLVLGCLSIVLITPTLRQVRAYKEFSCMTGMMLGMTTGMISGFLMGFFIGATNGMFVGGLFGMTVGIVLGVFVGKTGGVMGIMEGLMSGFMGGWMGAMTSVMLLNDHLKLASGIIFGVCAIILICLNYLIFTETRETSRQLEEDHFFTVFVSFILMVAVTWVMVFGPKASGF